jgi:hypothetical protein
MGVLRLAQPEIGAASATGAALRWRRREQRMLRADHNEVGRTTLAVSKQPDKDIDEAVPSNDLQMVRFVLGKRGHVDRAHETRN